MESSGSATPITLEQLPDLREKTERISAIFRQRLQQQLEVLRPLLAPARVFGRYLAGAGKDDVVGAVESWNKLQELYRASCGRPFGLQPALESSSLENLDPRVELYSWEYAHELTSEKERKTVTVTAPLRWLLSYRAPYSPSQLRQVLAAPGERKQEPLRQFLVSVLALNLVFEKNPGLRQILTDLRYEVNQETAPGLGNLTVTTVAAPINSIRPADDLIFSATRLSGVPAFIELVDPTAVAQMTDPLRAAIQAQIG